MPNRRRRTLAHPLVAIEARSAGRLLRRRPFGGGPEVIRVAVIEVVNPILPTRCRDLFLKLRERRRKDVVIVEVNRNGAAGSNELEELHTLLGIPREPGLAARTAALPLPFDRD